MNKRGDTLVEIMFSVAIFGAVAIGAITLMNRGLSIDQNSLETTMARQEIDTQIEALRFIHNAYISESKRRDESSIYLPIWQSLVNNAYDATDSTGGILLEDDEFYTRTIENDKTCEEIYSNGFPTKSFVINPRKLDSDSVDDDTIVYYDNSNSVEIRHANVYPRLIYSATTNDTDDDTADDTLSDAIATDSGTLTTHYDSTLSASEGIWVTAVKSGNSVQGSDGVERPDFYDFYVTTCWGRPDGKGSTTMDSILRLYNTDQIVFDNRPRVSGYTLNYNANGGTGTPEPQRYDDLTYSNHTFVISDVVPQNGDYRFVGWATSPDRSRGSYGHGSGLSSSITVYTLKTTLYAIWETPWVFQLDYDLNGGTLPSGVSINTRYPASGYTYDNSHQFTITSVTPSKTASEFVGWFDNSTQYVAGSAITLTKDAPNRTLKAKWRQHTHTLSYSGGSGVTNVPRSQTCVSDGTSCAITVSSTTPARSGYNFKGWQDSTGTTYQPGDTYTHSSPDSTITLSAIWERIQYTFTVKYSAKPGDSGVSNLPSNSTCRSTSSACQLTLSNDIPTRTGNYTFAGWTITSSGNAIYSPGDTYTHRSPNTTVTLYAVWALKSFKCYKRYRLQNADGTYPDSYTADGSSNITSGQSCSYQKSVAYYTTQSGSQTVSGSDVTISLSLPRTTYRLRFFDIDGVLHESYPRWGESVTLSTDLRNSYYVYSRRYVILGEWEEMEYGEGAGFTSGQYFVIDYNNSGDRTLTATYTMGKGNSTIHISTNRFIGSTQNITLSICQKYASSAPLTILGNTILYIDGTCWAIDSNIDVYANSSRPLASTNTLNYNGARSFCLSPWQLPDRYDANHVIDVFTPDSGFIPDGTYQDTWWVANSGSTSYYYLLEYNSPDHLSLSSFYNGNYYNNAYRAKVRCVRKY